MEKKILYIDMDNVLVDFPSAFPKIDKEILEKFNDDKDEIPGIFSLMEPMPGAIESVTFLSKHFDIYVLSTAPWLNPSAWTDKLLWIQKYFGENKDSTLYKRLILSHHKDLNAGDYLIDDRTKNGAEDFKGEHIHFGQGEFKGWNEVIDYLVKKEKLKI